MVYNGNEIEIVNRYKYFGYTLTTKLSANYACEGYALKQRLRFDDVVS